MTNTTAIDVLFLELSQFTRAKTKREQELENEIDHIKENAFDESVKHLKEQGDKYALHKNFILNVLEGASDEDLLKYFGSMGVELVDALREE